MSPSPTDNPLRAAVTTYLHLEKALAYGAAPFDTPELYTQGLTYRKLLDGRLGALTIACREKGAQVSLDGKLLFTAPGFLSMSIFTSRPRFGVSAVATLRVSGTRRWKKGSTLFA